MAAFGCSNLVLLNAQEASPALVEYFDLLPRRGTGPQPLPVHAVAEHQGVALLYIVDAEEYSEPIDLPGIQRQLANRSDPAWLGISRAGTLDIYPIEFRPEGEPPAKKMSATDDRAPLFFQSLVHGTFLDGKKRPYESDYVFRRIFDLLDQTSSRFVPTRLLQPLDVLSLCGRALFFRFLIDRRIVVPDELAEICRMASDLRDAFSNAQKAAATSAWLDATFNGDFLPLFEEKLDSDDREGREAAYLEFFRKTEKTAGKEIYLHLQAILEGWDVGENVAQLNFDEQLNWNEFNFAHIPVGVLSQVYESFSHLDAHVEAEQRSVHYTPRLIARLMVDEVFAAVKDPSRVQILDPACGAGIFLILAYRRLVRERWMHDEKRPDTRTLQSILYRQLCGFDVSESALRLAALGLYITAIELNGTQRPPKLLKFPNDLRGRSLFLCEAAEPWKDDALPPFEDTTFRLGSLHPDMDSSFEKRFDIVIGNPPWSRLRRSDTQADALKAAKKAKQRLASDCLNAVFTEIGKAALSARGLDDLAADYVNPDKNPDLPFLWKATQWAKDGGWIALALPARLIQHPTTRGSEPWQAVLRAVSITGLINGADLRWSRVWDGIKTPFCVLFAKNQVSDKNQRFYYLSPQNEPWLNADGRFRIDYESAQPVSVERVAASPWILKALSLGTPRDVELIEQIKQAFPQTLIEFWSGGDPKLERTGKGVDRSAGQTQKPAEYLGRLKHLQRSQDGFELDYESLGTYKDIHGVATAYRPKTEKLFAAPLVIVTEGRPPDRYKPKAFLAEQSITFSTSFYGYSCAEHREGKALAAMLYLLSQSILFDYWCLMTSAGIGADFQTLNKEELDAIPFPDPANLTEDDKAQLQSLASRLQRDTKKPWDEIDACLFALYGLDETDVQTARDTLFAAAAYRKAGQAALARTTVSSRAEFGAALSKHLSPFFNVCGESVSVVEPAGWQTDQWREPWVFLAVSREGITVPVNAALMQTAMEAANRKSASRIIVRAPGRRGLLIGLLNQRRWWTQTRALLCAQHIIRHDLAAFGLPASPA